MSKQTHACLSIPMWEREKPMFVVQ
jgi:hypothetical protein